MRTKYWCSGCNQIIYRDANTPTYVSNCAQAGDLITMTKVKTPKKRVKRATK
jgi:hypothetical protein